MSTITDQSTLFNFVTPRAWLGQYGASTGTQDMTSTIPTRTATFVDFNSNAKLTHGFNTYFKMQGFNGLTQKYEVWFSTGAPSLTPPSGNALSNIQVVLTWIDR